MPTLVEILAMHRHVARLQSNLVDFTSAGETPFEFLMSEIITGINSFATGDYCFKPSKLSLVITDQQTGPGSTYPVVSVGHGTGGAYVKSILDSTDFSSIQLNGQETVVNFNQLKDSVFKTEDFIVKVETASDALAPFTGYFVIEGSFIKMDL